MTSSHRYLYRLYFVPRSRNQPQEPNRWGCVCWGEHTNICVCACVCVCRRWNEDHSSGRIAYCHSWTAHTHTHTHRALLKRQVVWIDRVLSCCLLWMGKAAYLQWIVNPAQHSAVRDLWIANMLYLAPLIPRYLPPITSIVRAAQSAESKKPTLLKGNKMLQMEMYKTVCHNL